ncbi:glycoside hydrolase family 5 protein [Agromyces laixinhei]|uniref:glycoside hydrolase family 5 protein n=1 Tax=Agromyces laixinhei TaxID=2585717 RepID=UPI0012ED341F|nr:cellulase family glycosylhydrolase [Agromyces laixinhei]
MTHDQTLSRTAPAASSDEALLRPDVSGHGTILRTDGFRLRDSLGRHRVFHGINLISKGNHLPTGSYLDRGFGGDWTPEDIADLAARGFTLVRFGVIWAAVEPEPGHYDEAYLDWVAGQLDVIHDAGMLAVLDSHQDLYSQAFSDGAPVWATLTSQDFAATELWSDAYLASPAVHEALDQFWSNAAGPGGVGLQDRFAAMWAHVARRFRDHRAVVGYDLLNEPTPGSIAPQIFASLIGAFAHATGQDPEQVFADFADPEAKFAQLARLEDETVHREVGDAVHPLVAAFESDAVAPFMERVRASVRAEDPHGLILREHNYFANLGVPSGQPALDDANWAYSPHGYDLTVDTAAIALSSNTRAATIFSRHAETAERLGVPVIVGEWGALDLGDGVESHAEALQDVFDARGWSWTYWCWQKGFAASEAAAALTRPRPLAFAGDGLHWRVVDGTLHAGWRGAETGAPSVFFAPDGAVSVLRDGEPMPFTRDGVWVSVAAGLGDFELTVG